MSHQTILAVGSHPDDVELGCGATLLAHHANGDATHILVLSRGGRSLVEGVTTDKRHAEQENAARQLGANLWWGEFEDCAIPEGVPTIDLVESVIASLKPDIVYVHAPDDSHQDHRAVARSVLSAARRVSSVLHYQSPSTLNFLPTVYVDVADYLDGKLKVLACHESQVSGGTIQYDAISAAARYWGAFARLTYAEAFQPSRFVWQFTAPQVVPLNLDAERQ